MSCLKFTISPTVCVITPPLGLEETLDENFREPASSLLVLRLDWCAVTSDNVSQNIIRRNHGMRCLGLP